MTLTFVLIGLIVLFTVLNWDNLSGSVKEGFWMHSDLEKPYKKFYESFRSHPYKIGG